MNDAYDGSLGYPRHVGARVTPIIYGSVRSVMGGFWGAFGGGRTVGDEAVKAPNVPRTRARAGQGKANSGRAAMSVAPKTGSQPAGFPEHPTIEQMGRWEVRDLVSVVFIARGVWALPNICPLSGHMPTVSRRPSSRAVLVATCYKCNTCRSLAAFWHLSAI